MINLIPPHGHAILKREYILRVGAVYSFLFSVVLLAAVSLLIPTYVLVSSQLGALDTKEIDTTQVASQFRVAEQAIQEANERARQLGGSKESIRASVVIREIDSSAPHGIRLSKFQLLRENGTIASLAVQGVAESRTALATFKDELERLPAVKEALVPISDLAKDADLSFAITVILRE
jgi:hypothetical protein